MNESMSFEKSLERLEEIARKLESRDITLNEGIALYDNGLSLMKDCIKSLSESKGRISVLTKEMNKLIEEPFGED